MKSVYLGNFITRNKNYILRNAIAQGAKRCGYTLKFSGNKEQDINSKKIDESDILIIWNRHSGQDAVAAKFENRGARVLSIENPYIKIEKERWISVGYSHHNNIMFAPKCLDSGERFNSFNREIKPWKLNGTDIVITTQAKVFDHNGLGVGHIRQPTAWDSDTIETLKRKTQKNIVFRQHPKGKYFNIKDNQRVLNGVKISSPNEKNIPLGKDLENAWAMVTWNSNSATEALLEGVPVFYCSPNIISSDCCNHGLHNIETPNRPDNRKMVFDRIAWCQYSLLEVESGFFFNSILQ